MESPEFIFEANTFRTTVVTIILLLLSIATSVYLYFYNKKELSYQAKKRRGMINMVLFTAALIMTAAAFLNWWNTRGLKPVKVKKDAFELPRGELKYRQISKIYIYVDRPMTISTPPPDSVMNYSQSLIIEEIGKKQPHILSDDDYPIHEIFKKYRELNPKKKKN